MSPVLFPFWPRSPGRFWSVLLLFVMLAGCLPSDREFTSPMAAVQDDPHHTARISCFLVRKDDQGPAVKLELASLEVLVGESWFPLSHESMRLDSEALSRGQLFLGGAALPPGDFHRWRFTFTGGEARRSDGRRVVLADKQLLVEVEDGAGLPLGAEDSRTLLITWDVQNSLLDDNTLHPALTITRPPRQLLHDLIFVACPDIDTVYVVRVDKNWVVDSFGVKGRPTYLAVDPDPGSQLLYVLASRDRMVKVVDLESYRVVDFFPILLNDAPTFMALGQDGQTAFLLDEQSGYVSRMDLDSGQNLARVQLGYRPAFAVFLPDHNLLAVSLSLSQKVLLLDPESLQVKGTISTGNGPQGLVLINRTLYIAEYGSSTVTMADLFNKGRQRQVMVGFGPRRVLETGNHIYVSNYDEGSLSVLEPNQLGVTQEIFGLGRPLEMVDNPQYRRLYVADEKAAGLAIVDSNANLLIGKIALGARPGGLAVIQ